MKINKQLVREENPFYGSKSLFGLYQMGTKGSITSYLDAAWKEADTKEKKQLFHVINFGIGDISNRQHNIFKGAKLDQGGNSANPQWIEYLVWLLKNQPDQFIKFIPLIVEYVGLRELVTCQVKTQKGTKRVVSNWGLLSLIKANNKIYSALLTHITSMVQGSTFQKHQVAKFLHIPRYSNRIRKNKKGEVVGKRELQSNTVDKMKQYESLISNVSAKLNWEVNKKENYTQYSGFKSFKTEWGAELESLVFSTKEIETWDQEKFTNWLNILPSGARFKVQRRLFDGDKKEKGKWDNLGKWFTAWEKSKEGLQKEQRELEIKATKQQLTFQEEERLNIVKKAAKVTTGASTLYDSIEELLKGKANDITLQSILDKTKFEVPILPICDMSGSMSGRPQQIATLLATIALLKNPNTFDNMLIGFGSYPKVFTDNVSVSIKQNRFLTGTETKINSLVDRTATFQENFNKMKNVVNSSLGGTNFSGIAEHLKSWVDSGTDEATRATRREQVLDYEVMLVISDGDFNNARSAEASTRDFQMKMRQWFGWEGVIVIWDVPHNGIGQDKSAQFENLENVMHIGTYNISAVNQIFTKISDFEVIDIYTPLKSLYVSNRYNLVKQKVL